MRSRDPNTDQLHVVFGGGQLGYAVAAAARGQGHSVVVATRSGADGPPDTSAVVCDARDATAVAQVCAGAAVVYGCAHPPYAQWPELFPAIQRGLIEGVARAGAVFVAAENLYMYGAVDGPLREDLPYAATTRKGEVRALMAQELHEAHASGKVRTTSGRGSSFFGPRVTSSFMGPRVLGQACRGGIARVVGDPDVLHTYTYIADFARALVVLGQDPRSLGRAWHVPSAPTTSTREFLEAAARVTGARAKVKAVPRAVIRVGGTIVPLLREVQEMLYAFERPFVVDHARFASTFGDHWTEHRLALKRTADWMLNQSETTAPVTPPHSPFV